jgi:hypothetical protein
MALKAPRVIRSTDISLTCDTATERGLCVVYGATVGSGVALGDSAGNSTVATSASGKVPAGILLNDVVDIDTTRYHWNFHQDQTLINERCNLLTDGRVTTNSSTSARSPPR